MLRDNILKRVRVDIVKLDFSVVIKGYDLRCDRINGFVMMSYGRSSWTDHARHFPNTTLTHSLIYSWYY